MPFPATYELAAPPAQATAASTANGWLKVRRTVGTNVIVRGQNVAPYSIPISEASETNMVELGNRIVLQLKSGKDLKRLTGGHGLELSRVVASNVFILQAHDALTAAREAHRLSALPEVLASHPVMRRQGGLHGPYAYQPSDFCFSSLPGNLPYEWTLEHRNTDGTSAGVDINVRAAWPYTLGEGVTIAVVDTGIEMTHPELSNNVAGAPHYNFFAQNTNATPISRGASAAHGTEVAGLAAASINDFRLTGVAPHAKLASWVIYNSSLQLPTDEHLMDMYQYQSNNVAVQNHSWGRNGVSLDGPTLLEQIGIANAIAYGRSGRGVIMVRSCGNDRIAGANANDDFYASDPRVIAVAAVRIDGRAASYSEPGACVLVGAPGGDAPGGLTGLFTTDLLGMDGANGAGYFPPFQDMNNYAWFNFGPSGTSVAAPHISGIVALMLSVNPELTYRDIQKILILSSRHFDFADPDLVTNGAGLKVSHNVGFGVPDAGAAVTLARDWINHLPPTYVTFTASNSAAIPDDGLRLLISGSGVPVELASIPTLPGPGPHADSPTSVLPLVDFGYGTSTNGFNLTNKAALIQRQGNTYASQINLAAQLGAAFAVFYNDTNALTGQPLAGTDYVPIPAVFISHGNGESLKSLFQTNGSALAQIRLETTNYVFGVTNTLSCEHVGLRVKTDHQLRGDLRITLVSPSGTRSVLQRYDQDTDPGPVDWTYYSTHHFFESSAGNWTAYFSDEGAGNTGKVTQVSLILEGVQIHDRDKDGLDDFWEITYSDYLAALSPQGDPDEDGYSNVREQAMLTDPYFAEPPFQLDFSRWNTSLARVSWPGSPLFNYEIWGGTNADSLSLITNVPGQFPETEWFTSYNTPPYRFFRTRAIPAP